jgi:hypothetical protein
LKAAVIAPITNSPNPSQKINGGQGWADDFVCCMYVSAVLPIQNSPSSPAQVSKDATAE